MKKNMLKEEFVSYWVKKIINSGKRSNILVKMNMLQVKHFFVDKSNYSGDLKSDMWNPDFSKVQFQMVRLINDWALALTLVSYGKLVTYMNEWTSLRSDRQIRRTEYPEYNLGNTRTSQINNNGHSSGFQIPFKIWTIFYQPLFDHLKSRPVQISDPHCILLFL